MALDELFKTFEFLKKRIEDHRDYLSQDETRTRQVLIDPLLKELGWDVGDPNAVELEYRVEREYDVGMGKADYVLRSGAKLAAVIEAKRLGSTLLDKATNQVLNYANSKGVPWMVVSDGDKWTMYEVFKQGELKDRLRMSFAISESSASECALKSLALWRPNIRAHDGPVDASLPLIEANQTEPQRAVHSVPSPTVAGQIGEVSFEDPISVAEPALRDDVRRHWHPLTEVRPLDGKDDRNPSMMKFVGQAERPVSSWGSVYRRTAEYVVDNRLIRQEEYPVVLAERGPVRKCALNTSPVHPNGRRFYSQVEVRDGIWLDNGLGRNSARWLYSIRLLKRFGIDPATVQVAFD